MQVGRYYSRSPVIKLARYSSLLHLFSHIISKCTNVFCDYKPYLYGCQAYPYTFRLLLNTTPQYRAALQTTPAIVKELASYTTILNFQYNRHYTYLLGLIILELR